MEFLNQLLSNSEWPLLTAFILGLMTAISPCPMATNIAAIAFIGKDISSKKKVFSNGLFYILGRAVSYTVIGVILYFGASKFEISSIFQGWGEKILGPLLILFGVFMLGIINIPLPGFSKMKEKMEDSSSTGYWSSFLMGVVFALAFCPYSGFLYFGILIPITIVSAKGLYLPVVFAIGTGLPVIIFAWIIAFSVGGLSKMYNKIKSIETWFRRIVAAIFIGVGVYYSIIMFF